MSKQDRRTFLQISTGVLATGLSPIHTALSHSEQIAKALPENEGKKPMRLGLILGIGKDPDAAMAKVHELGLPTCQVFVDEIEPEVASRLRQALSKYQIEATSLVVGGPGRGFIPENPNDPVYKETIGAMREVAAYCKRNGQDFSIRDGARDSHYSRSRHSGRGPGQSRR